ncbi:MAG: RtcB family protein [Desulfobacterota bacterium]|nr:RtcB family protein [Thermodesulfobacteriota bacterium]MDW8002023.1 RtcB family protein [Deltaproteobacteria bacterium]
MAEEKTRIKRIDANRILIPKHDKMNVDGIVYVDEKLYEVLTKDESLKQVENVACLPGIVKASYAMPDIHWGYGFPIGGVAAFTVEEGVVSPGGVGYDINCGVRLIRSNLLAREVSEKIKEIIDRLFINVPSGVGSHRKDFKLSKSDLRKVVKDGAKWAVEEGYGKMGDLECIEDSGRIEGADPDSVSEKAYERGKDQLGTVGSGNHFVELGVVEEIYDEEIAKAFGLFKGQLTVLIHTGSRGFGYQICDDYIKEMLKASERYGIYLPDRQLCCAPVRSPEGKKYLAAMAAAANYAFANRQMITHWVRETFEQIFGQGYEKLGLEVVYDVCHNIAKIETHKVENTEVKVCVHRKGATRAFGPNEKILPEKYRKFGQPVIIPGDMGRASYVLCGTKKAMEETFGSTCHGAGRIMSRNEAIKTAKGREIKKELENKGIYVRAATRDTLLEEIPDAYKDVSSVVKVVHNAGISKLVAKILPLGCIKG